jgi:undecaprenyl-diphosphatase
VFAVAAMLAIIVKEHPAALPGDVSIELLLQHLLLPHKLLTTTIDGVSTITWPIPSALILVAMTVILLVLQRWLDALIVLFVAGFADGSSYLTNLIVRRPRPSGHGMTVLQHITNYYSFPSGHVIHVVAVFGIVLFLTYHVRRVHLYTWFARIILIMFIILIGPSRLLEGEHWPSDVLEGLLYGAFWLIVGIGIYNWARRRFPTLAAHAT